MEEIWKDIPGCEGRYQVSSLGRARSLSKIIQTGRGKVDRWLEARILKEGLIDKHGYRRIAIGDRKSLPAQTMHRVVAITFIPNPENKYCVNHIDGNKLNNNLDNLEWTTSKENTQHAFRTGLAKVSKEGVELRRQQFLNPDRNPKSRMVLNVETGIYYDSALKAWESTERKRNRDNFCALIHGKRKVKIPFVFA